LPRKRGLFRSNNAVYRGSRKKRISVLRHRQCGHRSGHTGVHGRAGHSALQGKYSFRDLDRAVGASSGGFRDLGDDFRNNLDCHLGGIDLPSPFSWCVFCDLQFGRKAYLHTYYISSQYTTPAELSNGYGACLVLLGICSVLFMVAHGLQKRLFIWALYRR